MFNNRDAFELLLTVGELEAKRIRLKGLKEACGLLENQLQLAQMISRSRPTRCHDAATHHPIPHWDAHAGELCFNGFVIKRFSKPAPNQRQALDAFDQAKWDNRILSPFRLGHTNLVQASETCKRTAEDLNDDHVTPGLIRFGNSGNGDYMTWREVGGK